MSAAFKKFVDTSELDASDVQFLTKRANVLIKKIFDIKLSLSERWLLRNITKDTLERLKKDYADTPLHARVGLYQHGFTKNARFSSFYNPDDLDFEILQRAIAEILDAGSLIPQSNDYISEVDRVFILRMHHKALYPFTEKEYLEQIKIQ